MSDERNFSEEFLPDSLLTHKKKKNVVIEACSKYDVVKAVTQKLM